MSSTSSLRLVPKARIGVLTNYFINASTRGLGYGVHAVERGMKVRYVIAVDLIETPNR
ncbi:MAG: hypothetical protein JO352_32975 [Chloroflexi bacterium]|nr:hypothetical protein [Chloroflexota bacterium]MBV9602662.1 hypothetical protein [Chloroflexota bacterium]